MRQDGEKFLSEDILKVKAAVIGDVMMDQYVTGSVNRISPEAPVPVNLVKGERNVPGGAANTAANLASLGCQVFVSGIVGNDQNGKMLLDLLKNAGIDSNGILVSDDYQTTAKIRILGAGQQMMRLDYERTRKLTDDECESVMEWLCGLLKAGLDCVVISDYGKGMIDDILSQKIIKKANEYNVPVLVDPKGSDWEKYDGAYGITPNLKELSDCAGKSIPNESAPIEAEGKRIREKFHLKYLFVTRSERGITCIMDGGAIHRASVAQDVFDVSGAGDTVMAVTAACAAAGIDMEKPPSGRQTSVGTFLISWERYVQHLLIFFLKYRKPLLHGLPVRIIKCQFHACMVNRYILYIDNGFAAGHPQILQEFL